ncbi:extracellular solute-binding protein [Terrilactibacillus tamarindi]|nr:extracellular solute-binding protein [Terrilactibacillus tamarindi]
MKKLLSLLFVLVLIFVTTGCSSGNGSDGNGKVTIRVLSSDDFADFRKEAVKEFEKENPNIKVNFESVAYDQLHDKELASFNASGDASYDVVDVDEMWTAEYADSAFIQPVTDKITDSMKKELVPASLNITKYKNDYYGFPMFNDTYFFYYNEDMLKKAGYNAPPSTWNEFTEMSKKLQSKGITKGPASAWGWGASEGLVGYFGEFLGSFGGQFLDNNGKPVFNSKEGVQALQYMRDSILKDKIIADASTGYNDRQILDAFKNGKTAFVSGWSFYWNELNADDSPVKGKVKVGLVPSANGSEHKTATGSMYLAVTPQSEHQDAAWKFIKFLGSKKIQKEQSLKAGALPVWQDLYKDPELKKNHPALEDMGKQLQYTISRPSLIGYNEFSKDFQIILQQVLLGKKDPKKALDEAVKKAKSASKPTNQ